MFFFFHNKKKKKRDFYVSLKCVNSIYNKYYKITFNCRLIRIFSVSILITTTKKSK